MSTSIQEKLLKIARLYPAPMVDGQIEDSVRIAHNIGLVLQEKGSSAQIADIGGGIGLFSVGCAEAGMKSILVDDFNDSGNVEIAEEVLKIHRSRGVTVMQRDVIKEGVAFPEKSLDVITCFEAMEHFHNSPRGLFKSLIKALKPGGVFILSVPNCVNLKDRVTGLLGNRKWSSMNHWYDEPAFRGHVREPDVDDLNYIARDLGFESWKVLGRNWMGYSSSKGWVRAATKVLDGAMRLRPTLCSNIYLIGKVSAK